MTILGCRERPPNPSVFRSTPAREWALSEGASNGAPFASSVFEQDDTHAALQALASMLFDPRRRPRQGGHDLLSFAVLQPQQPPQPPQPQQPPQQQADACAQGQPEEITDLTSHRACKGASEDAADRRGGSGSTHRQPKAYDDIDALAEDDFDFQFSKPAKAVRRAGGASSEAPAARETSVPGLDVLPSNHYEQVCDLWDRAILPPGGLVAAGGAQGAAEEGKPEGGRKREGKKDSSTVPARGRGAGGAKSCGGRGISSSIAPFFGGVGLEASARVEDKGKKEKEKNKCSICQQPGHSKRTCPLAEAGRAGEAPEAKKRRSKSAGDVPAEEARQSVQDKLLQVSNVATNLGVVDGQTGLDALFQRVASCECVVFAVLYTNNDTNLRSMPPKKGCSERELLGCALLITDHVAEEDERAANIFVPFLQAQGFTTTMDERRGFLRRVFSSEVTCPLVCFHAKPCLMALAAFARFQAPLFREAPVCCIKLAQWLLDPVTDPTAVSFDASCQETLSINPFSAQEDGPVGPAGSKWPGVENGSAEAGSTLSETTCRVLFQDLAVCAQMWELMADELRARDMEGAASLEMSLVPVISLMEEAGIGFSPTQLIRQRRAMERKLLELEEEATKVVGHPVLLTSPQQLCSVLFEELQLPPPKNGLSASTAANSVSKFKGAHQQYSTNEEVLTSLIDQHPLPAIVLEHRHVSKMLSGFVVPLCESAVRAAQRDGLSSIFTRWSQTSTATGRLSSSEPNLQNVPKQESVRFGNRTDMTKEINAHILRSAKRFHARQGRILLSIDYVQCELRIMAHFSQDVTLISLLQGESCPYTGIAARVQQKDVSAVSPRDRQIYKTVVLGLLYGQGQKSLAIKLALTEAQAGTVISNFFGAFPKVKEFKDACIRQAKQEGFVATLSGRRRAFPDLHLQGSAGGFKRAAAERQSVNFVIQGSASDCIKTAMKDIMQELCAQQLIEKCTCCLQIHDELVFEVDPGVLSQCAQLISKCMTDCAQLRVPMRVKAQAGRTWGELLPLEELLLADTPSSMPRAEAPAEALAANTAGTDISTGALPVAAGGASDGDAAGEEVAGDMMLWEEAESAKMDALTFSAGHAASETMPVTKAVRSQEAAARAGEGGEGGHGKEEGGRDQHADKKRQRDPFVALFDFESFGSKRASQPAAAFTSDYSHPCQPAGQGFLTQPTPPSSLALRVPGTGAPGVSGALTQHSALDPGAQKIGAEEWGAKGGEQSICKSGARDKVSMPLREIALSGINLHPLRANRLLGRPHGSKFSQPTLSLTSALFDDDTDQLDLDF